LSDEEEDPFEDKLSLRSGIRETDSHDSESLNYEEKKHALNKKEKAKM
jgi:hypothetical protein